MPWISVHQEVDGTKLRRLYRAIGCSKFEALGILNFLWFWGMKNADETGLVKDADLEVLSRYLYGCGEDCQLNESGKPARWSVRPQSLRRRPRSRNRWNLL